MIESIGSSPQIYFPNRSNSYQQRSLNNFDIEDRAIISAQAKILNELERFNAGEGSLIELALTSVAGEVQVKAAASVIKTKDEVMEILMKLGEED